MCVNICYVHKCNRFYSLSFWFDQWRNYWFWILINFFPSFVPNIESIDWIIKQAATRYIYRRYISFQWSFTRSLSSMSIHWIFINYIFNQLVVFQHHCEKNTVLCIHKFELINHQPLQCNSMRKACNSIQNVRFGYRSNLWVPLFFLVWYRHTHICMLLEVFTGMIKST